MVTKQIYLHLSVSLHEEYEVHLMTSLPVPLSQSVVPAQSPAICSSSALSLGTAVSQSAAWLPCLQQAGDSGKICKVPNFTDPL